MPFRIRLGFILCLALLPSCAPTLRSSNTDTALVPRHSGAVAGVPNPTAKGEVGSRFHFTLGVGAGKADVTCDGCIFDSRTGYSAFLSGDRAVAEKTLVGVEATGWTKERSGVTAQIWSLMAHLTQYLVSGSGVFLSGGFGLTGYRDHGGFRKLSGTGLGVSGRLGYEIRRGSIGIVPYVAYVRGLGDATLNPGDGNPPTDVTIHHVQFGLGITVP